MAIDEHGGQSHDDRRRVTVLFGGTDGAGSPRRPGGSGGSGLMPQHHANGPARREPDAAQDAEDSSSVAASGSWPEWARPQLEQAVELAAEHRTNRRRTSLAAELHQRWFNPVCGPDRPARPERPLVGLYRSAHAGGSAPVLTDGVAVVDRHDAIGPDGWWRTWGEHRSAAGSRSVRALFSPRADALGEFVCTVTAALLDARIPWLLACPLDRSRLWRAGSAVLSLPDATALPAGLIDRLRPTLRAATPALCLPVAPGVGVVERPDGPIRFDERRCRLIAVALRRPEAVESPLATIAAVFTAHGIDPGTPWRLAG